MKRLLACISVSAIVMLVGTACLEDHDPTAGFRPSVSPDVECRTVTSTLGTEQILVRASIDDNHTGWFLLESASSYIVADSRRVTLPGREVVGKGQFPRPCRTSVTFHQVAYVDIGPMRIDNAYVGLADLTDLEDLLGEQVLGIVGASVFHRAVVEVEFAANDGDGRVSLYDPETYTLARGEWTTVDVSRFEMVVPATFERAIKGAFVIDTGYSGNVSIFSAFAVNKQLLEGREFVERPAFTLCGKAIERETRIDKFKFAGKTYDQPTVAFMQPGSAPDVNTGRLGGVIGRGFLRDFLMVTDVANGRIAFVSHDDSTHAGIGN